MKAHKHQNGFVIRLEKDEKVLATLAGFCAERGVQSGSFQAIGAVKNAEIGYYSLEKREYFFKTLPEDREVASMFGNVTLVDGKPFIHAHAVLSSMDDALTCAGGHVKEAEVAVTLEVFLTTFDVAVCRELDDSVGLKLLNL